MAKDDFSDYDDQELPVRKTATASATKTPSSTDRPVVNTALHVAAKTDNATQTTLPNAATLPGPRHPVPATDNASEQAGGDDETEDKPGRARRAARWVKSKVPLKEGWSPSLGLHLAGAGVLASLGAYMASKETPRKDIELTIPSRIESDDDGTLSRLPGSAPEGLTVDNQPLINEVKKDLVLTPLPIELAAAGATLPKEEFTPDGVKNKDTELAATGEGNKEGNTQKVDKEGKGRGEGGGTGDNTFGMGKQKAINGIKIPRAELVLALRWNTEADLDFYLTEPAASGGKVLYYDHQDGVFGKLTHDDSDGFGPEIIRFGPFNKEQSKIDGEAVFDNPLPEGSTLIMHVQSRNGPADYEVIAYQYNHAKKKLEEVGVIAEGSLEAAGQQSAEFPYEFVRQKPKAKKGAKAKDDADEKEEDAPKKDAGKQDNDDVPQDKDASIRKIEGAQKHLAEGFRPDDRYWNYKKDAIKPDTVLANRKLDEPIERKR